MNKNAERINVLTENNSKNFVHAILNAVAKGYADETIIEDVIDLVKSKEISRGILATAPEALRSYAKSISGSLSTIADEVESLEIQEAQEQIVNRKRIQEQVRKKEEESDDIGKENDEDEDEEENVIRDEMKDDEEKEDEEDEDDYNTKHSKKASSIDIKIAEDWDKTSYSEKENRLAGILKINFNQNMEIYQTGDQVNLRDSAVRHIKNKIFGYLKNEYPRLRVKLSSEIFKGNVIFDDVKKGSASIEFEINKAY